MRPIIWTFVILSPVISIAQSDHAPQTHLAHALVTHAALHVAAVVHALQTLLA